MPKAKTSIKEINRIINLRKKGHSLSEINQVVFRGKATIYKYIKDVKLSPTYEVILKSKQRGSVNLSKKNWRIAKAEAERLISGITDREKLIILSCLYWGEGNKKELNLVNSDPNLIKVFIECLSLIGITKDMLKVTLRIYDDLSKKQAIIFWSNVLEIPKQSIKNVNILKGKKDGKLKYGMCRIRVIKGGKYFKLIMSMIDLVRFKIIPAAVVQRIEQDTPNV